MLMSLRNGRTIAQKVALTATVCGLVVALGACSMFGGRKDDTPEPVASEGQRKTIIAFQQKIEPSRSLKNVGFYLPDAVAVADWPVTGGPQGQPVEHVAAGQDFKVAWSKSIGSAGDGHSSVLAQPVSDGNLIFTLDGAARVSAFDVGTGREVWSVNLDPQIKRDKVGFGGGLAVSDGKLYVTSGFRFIVALDAASGAEVWKKALDTQFRSAPTVSGGSVYAIDVENQVFAFNAATGLQQWTYQAISEPARILRAPSPVVVGGTVYAPFSSGELVALKSGTGEEMWKQTLAQSTRTNALSQIRDISGYPVISNGVIYAASHSGNFLALDQNTGAPRWQKPLPVDSVNAPWAAGDVVFLLDINNQLIATNRESGQVYWIKELTGPAKAKEDKGMFSAWGSGPKKEQWTGPVLASNRLVFVTSGGRMIGLDPKTGDQVTSVNLGGAAYLSPIAVGNMLFVVTEDAKLVAVR